MRLLYVGFSILGLCLNAQAQPADDPVITKARAAVTKNLKDPASARFEGLVKRPGAVCGFVNAKNSMGGYTGRQMFVYLPSENRAWVLEINGLDVTRGIALAETHCSGVPGF
jgi:hypothetical protein